MAFIGLFDTNGKELDKNNREVIKSAQELRDMFQYISFLLGRRQKLFDNTIFLCIIIW